MCVREATFLHKRCKKHWKGKLNCSVHCLKIPQFISLREGLCQHFENDHSGLWSDGPCWIFPAVAQNRGHWDRVLGRILTLHPLSILRIGGALPDWLIRMFTWLELWSQTAPEGKVGCWSILFKVQSFPLLKWPWVARRMCLLDRPRASS